MSIQVGDRVAYSAKFLRSIGCYSGDMPHARGTVTALQPLGQTTLAVVDWNTDEIPRRVNTANLAKVGTPAMNAN